MRRISDEIQMEGALFNLYPVSVARTRCYELS